MIYPRIEANQWVMSNTSWLFDEFVTFGPESEFTQENELPNYDGNQQCHDRVSVTAPVIGDCKLYYRYADSVLNCVRAVSETQYFARDKIEQTYRPGSFSIVRNPAE